MNTHTRRVNRLATKVIIALVLVFGLVVGLVLTSDAQTFSGRTKHKTVKRMSKRQLRNAQKGKTFYYRKHGKINKRKF